VGARLVRAIVDRSRSMLMFTWTLVQWKQDGTMLSSCRAEKDLSTQGRATRRRDATGEDHRPLAARARHGEGRPHGFANGTPPEKKAHPAKGTHRGGAEETKCRTAPATSEARLLMNRVSLLVGVASVSHDSASRPCEDLPPCTCDRFRLPSFGHGEPTLPKEYGNAACAGAAQPAHFNPRRSASTHAKTYPTSARDTLSYRQYAATTQLPRPAA